MKGNDRILESFMSIAENKDVYKIYMKNPTQENKERLDHHFKKHFYIIRCISYFIKLIHFESRHFDQKQRKRDKIYQLSLDQENESGQRNIELITDHEIKEYPGEKLEQVISDPILYSLFLSLTDRQRMLLNRIYVDNLKDTEVAVILGITQQAVTKAKKNAISKLRKGMS
ncbi:sigma-70 family RNA polymerase sigma factor [Sporosarcina sp. Sa2YVA2]|uniref:Sigma-70 family RNA polymerase sigma factor n=1 Tax=Sporosarcina quadrami TaxID=2762234 RepID=A0ABR8U6X1_9BACL|nr:sigma-70 family RNA polymerase sigma factor [Sporosarcina quadrami]MBD7983776.1 sigma-70 family RNA polymerase sigma factor [Sporosarcina quadrami]